MRVGSNNVLVLSVFAGLLSGCVAVVNSDSKEPDQPDRSNEIDFVSSAFNKANDYPFSQLVEADGWVFLSGAIGNAPGSGLVAGGIEAETRQCMDNIEATLNLAGLGMSDVVKCTVMLADMAEWGTFNQVYKTYFDGVYPARSAFGANGLALGARVEVECIARR